MFKNLKYIKPYDILSIFIFTLLIIPSLLYKLYLKITGERVWLITEDGHTARDNGYYFYKSMRNDHKDLRAYYVIDKKSHDYEKVKDLGNIVQFRSIRHWIYYFSCEYNISSQKNGNPSAPFFYALHVKAGLFNNRVFLQHGIIKDDTEWLYYKNCKFKHFICGAKREYDYVSSHFGYPEGSVVFTGLARHDYLKKNVSIKDSQILIMPTWRNWLGRETNSFSKQEPFTETEFYKNWNDFLNNKEFIEFIEANNLKVKFYPHINMQKYLSYFKPSSKNIELVSPETDIQKVLKESALMITDYTSAAMDFALLKKPIVYFQFDQKEFRERQYQTGYYDYEKDGFGPVTTTAEKTIAAIKKFYRKNKFENTEQYEKRSEAFFSNNSEHTNCDNLYNILMAKKQTQTETNAKKNVRTALVYASIATCFMGWLSFYYFYTVSPFMIAGFAILIYRIVFKVKTQRPLFKFELLYALFLLAAVISCYFSYDRYQSVKILVKITAIIFSALQCRTLYYETGKDELVKAFRRVSFVFIVVTFILYICSLFALNFNFNIENIKLPGVMIDREMPRLMTLSAPEPNASCQFLVIPFIYFLCFLHSVKNKREKAFFIINIILYTAAMVLTLSRGGIVTAVCVLAFYYLFCRQTIKTKAIATAAIVFAILLPILASVPILHANNKAVDNPDNNTSSLNTTAQEDGKDKENDDNAQDKNQANDSNTSESSFAATIANRFTTSDGGSGRMRLWKNAITTFKAHPVIGIGVNSSISYNANHYGGHVYVVHNMYLDVLSETGVIGAFFFMLFIIVLVKKTFELRKYDNAFSLVTIAAFLIGSVFLSKQFWEIFFINVLAVDLCLSAVEKRLNNIKVSVIMPTLNTDKEYLQESIKSILSQTHQNLEFIIVSDGGDDHEYIKSHFGDERIIIIKHDKPLGIARSLNDAISLSTGKYIARMDADDISTPRRIERQVRYMEQHPDIIVSSTFYKKIGGKKSAFACESYTSPGDVKARLLFVSPIPHPAVIIRRSSIDSIDPLYDERYERAEDYELWCRLSSHGHKISLAKIYGLKYRKHPLQVSTSKRHEQLIVVEKIYASTLAELGLNSSLKPYLFMLSGDKSLTDRKGLKSAIRSILAANREKKIYGRHSLKKVLWSTYAVRCLRNHMPFFPNRYFVASCAKKVAYKSIALAEGVEAKILEHRNKQTHGGQIRERKP